MPRFDSVPFDPRDPISVRGGIRARSRRGGFGASWWSRRWIDVLEGFNLGARLSRGRSYARRGQVLSIEVVEGVVKARVQGSRVQPYRVTIRIATLDSVHWERLAASMGARLHLMADLLAGRMPDDIEEIFDEAGLSLFPSRQSDLQTRCSCPDSSNPCKHVAAVYLLLGEEFDRDPFLVFKLRGADRETLLGLLKVQDHGKRTRGRRGRSRPLPRTATLAICRSRSRCPRTRRSSGDQPLRVRPAFRRQVFQPLPPHCQSNLAPFPSGGVMRTSWPCWKTYTAWRRRWEWKS